jgi:hypothetical protein
MLHSLEKDNPSIAERVFARYKLNTGLFNDAQKAFNEALNLMEEATRRLSFEVHKRQEKRSSYLNSLV